MAHYDAIVIGSGGVGSAAAYHLAGRGARVLGLDRFRVPHDRGSSHGHTRIFRQAYFEHADYVPLARHSLQLWNALSEEAGQPLLRQIGLVEFGPPDGQVVPGVLSAARQHSLRVESLTANQAREQWTMFDVPDDWDAVHEPDAGYLLVEDCLTAHVQLAQERGAEFRFDETVTNWSVETNGFRVATDRDTYTSDALVVTTGAWAGPLLGRLGVPLRVLRKPLFWLGSDDPRYQVNGGMPLFLFELPEGVFYGFPQVDDRGVKIAEHSGGSTVDDPLLVDREMWPEDRRRIESFAARHLPALARKIADHAVCLYTMSPDEHFLVDRHPQHERLVLAAGLSGHGFKFTPALGQALADLALDGRTDLPIGFLSLNRQSLRSAE